jgi:hypothetical protein
MFPDMEGNNGRHCMAPRIQDFLKMRKFALASVIFTGDRSPRKLSPK